MKFSIKDFFSKCDQIRTHLLKKSLMENVIFLQWISSWYLASDEVKNVGWPEKWSSSDLGGISSLT